MALENRPVNPKGEFYKMIEKETKADMDKALVRLKDDLKGLRTNRANPSLLDRVMVEVYGTQMKLRDIANITTPESRQLLIAPFDPQNANAIAKAIENANLNVQPVVEGNAVRINIPPMSEDVRKEIVKECKRKAESTKVEIRNIRRKINDMLKKKKNDGEIAEDAMRSYEKQIQKLTDDYCAQTDQICSLKEKEILEI